jgi:hypothetical protein
MFEDDTPTYLDLLVEAYERSEDNLNALEDSRFGEIYLHDKENTK